MKTPKAILFDVGNTLLAIREYNPERGVRHILSLVRENPRGIGLVEFGAEWKKLDALVQPLCDSHRWEFHAQAFGRLVCDRLGLVFDRSWAEMEMEFWQEAFVFEPEPGITETLAALQDQGIRLAAISNSMNSEAVLRRELEQFGLMAPLEFVMTSADYIFRKPHPLLFETGVLRLNLVPSEVWYAGDLPAIDVAGAREAGLGAIWYNPHGKPLGNNPEPDITLSHWHDLTCQPPFQA